MTYRELAELIGNMTEEQKECNVTVFLTETSEYYSLDKQFPVVFAEGDNDVLQDGHPYLAV